MSKVENQSSKTMRKGRKRKQEQQKALNCTRSCKVAPALWTGDRNRHEDTCQNIYKNCKRTNFIFQILLS